MGKELQKNTNITKDYIMVHGYFEVWLDLSLSEFVVSTYRIRVFILTWRSNALINEASLLNTIWLYDKSSSIRWKSLWVRADGFRANPH